MFIEELCISLTVPVKQMLKHKVGKEVSTTEMLQEQCWHVTPREAQGHTSILGCQGQLFQWAFQRQVTAQWEQAVYHSRATTGSALDDLEFFSLLLHLVQIPFCGTNLWNLNSCFRDSKTTHMDLFLLRSFINKGSFPGSFQKCCCI